MGMLGPTLYVFSHVLMAFALAFAVPMGWAWFHDDMTHELQWAQAAGLTLVSGALLWLLTRRQRRELATRDGFVLVNLVWLVLPAYAALPLKWMVPGITWHHAYFEAMSALTATGATALSGLERLPVSVNVWRCFLQYVGGLGVMLLVVAVLPMLGLGGMQLYKAETPGPMKDQKLTPRIAETARGLWTVYFAFSVACFLSYRWAGMGWADAFMHMCTTMGLAGFSSYDASLGAFQSPAVEWVAVVFMALAGISFLRYFMVLRGLTLKPLWADREIRTYAAVLLAAIAWVAGMLAVEGVYADFPTALRMAAFHVVSLATTTGYATTDYLQWPPFIPVFLLFLGMFVSCAGSTGGGIKMVRMVLLIKQARRELVRILHPHVVNPVTLGGQAVPAAVMNGVLGFMLIYGAATVGLAFLLLLSGLDVVTAFSAVIATVNNIGPGLGEVGPAGNYGGLTPFQLWVLSFAMLLGRLELLSVLVLFTRAFWRR
ncbi:Trk system potassium uptake protein TrkH [Tepidimonas alkaliphilus]|uniref:Trk system potassium uptake protein n=1 Tax=Tepidimonas alkaliphilus TaxID=2588942 RepID=A0A554WB96_9BURK|nr:potassium transporter TrkG [Tepidimonas alkaliphilus]TSE20836.1 Trk system potassium uptake protein TrkH [Tepidimonas alkaliphilus]